MRAVWGSFTGLLLLCLLGCENNTPTASNPSKQSTELKATAAAGKKNTPAPDATPQPSDTTSPELDTTPASGQIKGKIVLKGDVPEKVLAISKGDATVKNSEICAAIDLYKNDLIIDSETKGIANVFIFMKDKPEGVEFAPPDQKKLILDQKNCRFIPHAMIVRTGQIVEVISSDNCAHNFHSHPIRGTEVNQALPTITPVGQGIEVTFTGPEFVPIPVNCDFHTWMTGRWLIVDHPFAGMTDEAGEFTINKGDLPDGTYEFRVWHERSGWLEKSMMIEIKGNVTDLGTMEYELAEFAED